MYDDIMFQKLFLNKYRKYSDYNGFILHLFLLNVFVCVNSFKTPKTNKIFKKSINRAIITDLLTLLSRKSVE